MVIEISAETIYAWSAPRRQHRRQEPCCHHLLLFLGTVLKCGHRKNVCMFMLFHKFQGQGPGLHMFINKFQGQGAGLYVYIHIHIYM